MSKKRKPDHTARMMVVIDYKTLKKINKLAERYGIEPEDVLRELIEIETTERPDGVTLH